MSQTDEPVARFESLADLETFLVRMGGTPCEGEGLSELDHGLQCAEVLRVMAPDDVELQIAGLLHDVGSGWGHTRDHGRLGGLAVRDLLGERVAALVRLHVDAKRYLVTDDPTYRARLSPASIATLELQGGDMNAEEMAAFAASPFRDDAIRLREADDLAKVPGKPTPGLGVWISPLRRAVLPIR
ncbi:MAG TPA: HD domain-containing protein [Caulobacteraceae bacterium]|jgi:predicted HD phosphohydrolase|nr:HD domain-containing protein [Caulobacteraceae bacterium]